MAWVWKDPIEFLDMSANIDDEASGLNASYAYLRDQWVDPTICRPIFRTRSKLEKFTKLHCPPIWVAPAVDGAWRDIILKFVPEDRVQFLPIRLIARGGAISDDYFWPIVMDRVFCIDPEKSTITQQLRKGEKHFIFGVSKFVHIPSCLGKLHLARDARMDSHLLVSDELKEALAATGEDSMFYRPGDIVNIHTKIATAKNRHLN
jgi:hypothetical protein